MIFTERTIRVSNGTSSISSPIILYKGDKNIKIRFKIVDCPYTYSKNVDNIIETSEASYAQLIIKTPNNGSPILSDIAEPENGYVTFIITGEMIDEAKEVGKYSLQVRLLDDEQYGRITIPEVVDGIEVREPMVTERVSTTNEVDVAVVDYAVTTAAVEEDAFDSEGNYIETNWQSGNVITSAKLNKIEKGITGVNSQIKDIGKPTDEQVAAVINQAIEDGKITSGNGWSTTAITLFESLISTLAFTDITAGKTLAASLINELKSGSGGSGGSSGGETGGTTPSEETYTITYSLGEATSSNNATTVVKNSSYTTTLSNPSNGYISNVSILMNNVDITSTAYTENTKTITIENVTGNIIITVETQSSDNLVDSSTFTDGESMPNGASITPGTYLITDYIEVDPSTSYYINMTRYIDESNSDWGQGVFYYTQDKTYKGYYQITTNSPFNTMNVYTTLDESYFIRIKFHVNYRDVLYFGKSGVSV